MTIKQRVEARGIKFLVHFTRADNVDGILTHGLIPRAEFDGLKTAPVVNDDMRLDYCVGATSVSISFPNYKMFYRYRQENLGTAWAVMFIDPSVLWKNECAFCIENAAKSSVSSVPLKDRMGVGAFESLFDEIEGKPSRASMKLPDHLPTHPQAEVLVFGAIDPALIAGAAYNNNDLVKEAQARHPKRQFKNIKAVFDARVDYQHWK